MPHYYRGTAGTPPTLRQHARRRRHPPRAGNGRRRLITFERAFDFSNGQHQILEDHQRDTIEGGPGDDVMDIDDGYDLAGDIEVTI